MARPARAGLAAALAALVVAAPAEAAVINESTPFQLEFQACNGELVTGDGLLHVVVRSDDEGNPLSAHFRAGSATVVGETTGRTYRVVWGGNTIMKPGFDSAGPTTMTLHQNVISPGGEENFRVSLVAHFTFNANGVPTAYQNAGSFSCV